MPNTTGLTSPTSPTSTPDFVTQWAKIEGNTPRAKRFAVHGAIGDANSQARFEGRDENDAHNPAWAKTAVEAFRQIAGA